MDMKHEFTADEAAPPSAGLSRVEGSRSLLSDGQEIDAHLMLDRGARHAARLADRRFVERGSFVDEVPTRRQTSTGMGERVAIGAAGLLCGFALAQGLAVGLGALFSGL